jgi:hypothetical protein
LLCMCMCMCTAASEKSAVLAACMRWEEECCV